MRNRRASFIFVLALVCDAAQTHQQPQVEDRPASGLRRSLMERTASNVHAAVSAVGSQMMRAEGVKKTRGHRGRQRFAVNADGDDVAESAFSSPNDCQLSDWTDWSVCQFTCGPGNQLRTRHVKKPASLGGSECDDQKQEERKCQSGECPVDCKWEDWQGWTACNTTCGYGVSTSIRNHTRAQYGGAPCQGDSTRYQECHTKPCVIDCLFNDWGEWYPCSVTCGGGERMRTRQVVQEKNELGKACNGSTLDTGKCKVDQCPVDCQMSDWGLWDMCTVSCGGGTTHRQRVVTQAVEFGGQPCENLTEDKTCSTQQCPSDCEWNAWSDWLPCSASCGDGGTKRYRTFANVGNDWGDKCNGGTEQSRNCSMADCPLDCEMSDWTSWIGCSVTCGPGHNQRTREITRPATHGGRECEYSNFTLDQKYCSLDDCPVDCQYSDWSEWIDCPVSCGNGTSYRNRMIQTNALLGGKQCEGGDHQERLCAENPCPKHCEWKEWAEWSECSVTCGDGKGNRTRDRIPARYGGEECVGPEWQEGLCQPGSCPVDCQWDDWTDWACTVTCGSGASRRHRGIGHPAELGGASCFGPDMEESSCHLENAEGLNCPIDCQWGDWSEWGACSDSCGHKGMAKRSRQHVVEAQFGGQSCFGPKEDEQGCNRHACPEDCVFADWGQWTACPVTCGTGWRGRERKVKSPAINGGAPCVNHTDSRACATHPCPVDCVWNSWSDWTPCTISCGGGKTTRSRTEAVAAQHGGRICDGGPEDEDTCSVQSCPVDCQWNPWSDWYPCSATCNGGERLQRRTMEAESYGGNACLGNDTKPELCNDQDCPVDCVWSVWTAWSECSKSCNGGSQDRSRLKSPVEQDGGRPCEGQSTEERECNTDGCPRDCEWGPWSRWTPCSKFCDLGVSKRFRDVIITAQNNGVPCAGKDEEDQFCNPQPCSQDCLWNDWTEWTACSESCDGGTRYVNRTRKQEQRNEGKVCEGERTLVEPCNNNPCPVDCVLSDWGDWSICSQTCYTGVRMRTRTREEERNGGLPCNADLMEEGQCHNAPNALHCPDPDAPSTTTVVAIDGPPGIAASTEQHSEHEKLRLANFDVVHYKQTEWDPEIDHGKHWEVPSHADITKSYDSKFFNKWHAGAHEWGHQITTSTTTRGADGGAKPCNTEQLKATMDVYEASSLHVQAHVDDWTQDGIDVTAKVRGNLTVYAGDSDKFRTDSTIHRAMVEAMAQLCKVVEGNVEVKMITSQALQSLEEWQKQSRGNAIINFRVNVLKGSVSGEDAVTAALKSQSSKQVTFLLRKAFEKIGETTAIYATGLKFAVDHREHTYLTR
eukprot:gb/GFBE01011429.1/.p1 GENE.gb/GFBE01011429.1/~~gb/GFBE01011429.1/.p1  ORF type:complete len:1322 (+),score=241.23 gb/GFBE01011429.1/:1-3966(+)